MASHGLAAVSLAGRILGVHDWPEIERVRRYIQDQEEHHRQRTFEDEYRQLLTENGIDFDERYLL